MAQNSAAAATFDRVTKLSQAALADLILVDMEQLKEKASGEPPSPPSPSNAALRFCALDKLSTYLV